MQQFRCSIYSVAMVVCSLFSLQQASRPVQKCYKKVKQHKQLHCVLRYRNMAELTGSLNSSHMYEPFYNCV